MQLKIIAYFILLFRFTLFAEDVKISGTVSNQAGKPISGAIIILKGQNLRDTTDSKGEYSLTNGGVSTKSLIVMPHNEEISIKNGSLYLKLEKEAQVKIEFYDLTGNFLKRELDQFVSKGDYRYNLIGNEYATRMTVVRIIVGGQSTTFRLFQGANGKYTSSLRTSGTSYVNKNTLAKIQTTVDSLDISAPNYITKVVPVFSLNQVINITMDTLALSYGTFLIQLIPENLEYQGPAYTKISGTIWDGPSPPNIIFKEVMHSGPCKLMKAVFPSCSQNCQIGYHCIIDDSCMPEPKMIDVGTVTVKGLKNTGGLVNITMEPPKSLYYQMVNVPLVYPPFSEGDTITVSVAGKNSVAPFTIKVRGITPLVVLSNDILVEDGKDVTLQWVPPAINGLSTIYVRINISYHGGTRGEIQAECEDNGSLTIPGAMLDKLKSYGIAGYPLFEIIRKSVGYNEDTDASVIVECPVTRYLTIPGVNSCNGDGDCPGKACIDKVCQ